MDKEIKEQLSLLKHGTVEIFTEAELADKLVQAKKEGRQLRIKLGLDPTSPDIHLGHTVVLRKMRQFQDAGHKAVLIIGDYTARIGDPSGQNTTRPILMDKQIKQNAETYFEQAGKVLDTSKEKLEVRYNSGWLTNLNLADIIKLTSNMTVARMLERDTFEMRHKKGEPIGIHEFLYPLMQGYDSVIVKSDIELGGTDQTFNNLVGRDLQRINGQVPQVVLTMPILAGLDGKEKMSKSKGNYIGIKDDPNNMFGKVMSISDQMMRDYYALLTNKTEGEIAVLVDPGKTHPKEAKVKLGKIIVSQFYDEGTAEAAASHFQKVFSQRKTPDNMPEIKVPDVPIAASKLLLTCQLAETGGEAKRMIKQAGVSINGKKITDPNAEITPTDGMVIQVGKRKFARIKTK